MTVWPNWVDLIVITTVFIGCYNGFGRGLLAEILNLIGAASVTSIAINYWSVIASKVQPWVPMVSPIVAGFAVFWLLFLSLWLVSHVLIKRITDVVKWERIHWLIQGIGLILGAIRGAWWSALILVTVSTSGFAYLQQSVEERSVTGARFSARARASLEEVANRFPGAEQRGKALIPPIRVQVGPKS